MKTTDHFILGNWLCNDFFAEETFLRKFLFVIGNIFPDLFPHTYLRKCFSAERLRGHNYLNTRDKVKICMQKMLSLKRLSIFDFLRLGILIHYVADAFTFAHNNWFPGTLKQHVEYEEELHKLFTADFRFCYPEIKKENICSKKLFVFYDTLHQEYENEIMETKTDFKYINFMTEFTVNIILTSCNEKTEKSFDYIYLEDQTEEKLLAI